MSITSPPSIFKITRKIYFSPQSSKSAHVSTILFNCRQGRAHSTKQTFLICDHQVQIPSFQQAIVKPLQIRHSFPRTVMQTGSTALHNYCMLPQDVCSCFSREMIMCPTIPRIIGNMENQQKKLEEKELLHFKSGLRKPWNHPRAFSLHDPGLAHD